MHRSNAHQQFIDYLRSEGKNITPERLDILDTVIKQKAHFKIDDIIHIMTQSDKPISRATVYRTIKTIEEAGLVKYLHSINDEKIYELQEEHHDHMICESCGRIIEFHDKDLEKLQDEICRSHGFSPQRHTMKIFGVCERCKG